MKKAKIMLTTIAVLAIVGVGLAFQAKKSASQYFVCDKQACTSAIATAFVTADPLAANTTTTVVGTLDDLKTCINTTSDCGIVYLQSANGE
jgi:hypothetical protein